MTRMMEVGQRTRVGRGAIENEMKREQNLFGADLYCWKEPFGADLYAQRPQFSPEYYCDINSKIIYR